ncbi:hypothetical protein OUZ56_002374 [Daphnia magna]|uniref:Uncharacterized protein n=1 Tax=Daphnia magna TaxID=35525 RepID=A0ABR0A5H1_9CRUS|nr:hypothetical protein OUZ56_002374 [Daphnia magna]
MSVTSHYFTRGSQSRSSARASHRDVTCCPSYHGTKTIEEIFQRFLSNLIRRDDKGSKAPGAVLHQLLESERGRKEGMHHQTHCTQDGHALQGPELNSSERAARAHISSSLFFLLRAFFSLYYTSAREKQSATMCTIE